MTFTSFCIANARPAPITDRVLSQLTRVAYDAPQSLATEAECEWLLACIGPLMDELTARRAFMAGLGCALPDGPNVVALPVRR